MSIELKIKAVSLQQEARYIRKHEQRFLRHARRNVITSVSARRNFESLHNHRTTVVRSEARSTNLARAALKGVPYRRVEQSCHQEPDYHRVHKMLQKYGAYSEWSLEKVRRWFTSEEGILSLAA